MESNDWQPFLSFSDRGSAEAVSALLQAEEVPTVIEAARLVAGFESEFRILVPTNLIHRARWVLSEFEFSDSEFEYLATGKLPRKE